MANIGQLGLTAAMAVVAGLVVGRMTAPEAPTAPAPSPAVAPTPARSPRAETKSPDAAAESVDDDETEALREQLQACETARAEVDKLQSILASPFPPKGVETPGAWQTLVRKCDVSPAALVVVDCLEYPCFAGVRRPADAGPMPTGPERAKERLEVEATLRQCDAVKAALGENFDEGAVIAVPLEASCKGKAEAFWGVVVLDPKGPAYEAATEDDETPREAEHLLRWADRRAAALRAKWPCAK